MKFRSGNAVRIAFQKARYSNVKISIPTLLVQQYFSYVADIWGIGGIVGMFPVFRCNSFPFWEIVKYGRNAAILGIMPTLALTLSYVVTALENMNGRQNRVTLILETRTAR